MNGTVSKQQVRNASTYGHRPQMEMAAVFYVLTLKVKLHSFSDDIGMKLIADQNTETKSQLASLEHQPVLSFHLATELEDRHTNIEVECVLYYCGKDGACRMKGLVFEQPVWVTKESVDLSETMTLTYRFTE